MAKCQANTLQAQRQERQVTTRQDKMIKHEDDNHFLINTFAIHNATLLQKILPRQLIAPKKLYDNRQLHHAMRAATLRVDQTAKRARTQEKRKATNAAKQAKKQQHVPAEESEGDNENDINSRIVREEDSEPPAKRHKQR